MTRMHLYPGSSLGSNLADLSVIHIIIVQKQLLNTFLLSVHNKLSNVNKIIYTHVSVPLVPRIVPIGFQQSSHSPFWHFRFPLFRSYSLFLFYQQINVSKTKLKYIVFFSTTVDFNKPYQSVKRRRFFSIWHFQRQRGQTK